MAGRKGGVGGRPLRLSIIGCGRISVVADLSVCPLVSSQDASFYLCVDVSFPPAGVLVSVLRRNAVVTVVVSVALVVGVVSPAYAGGGPQAHQPGKVSVPATSVAPLHAAKGAVDAPSAAATDEGPSPTLGVKSAPAVTFPKSAPKSTFNLLTSSPVGYGPNETTYRNMDGSFTEVVSAGAKNFHRADGSWVPAATKVAADAKPGVLSVSDNPLSPKFPATMTSKAGYSVSNGGDSLTMTPVGAASSNAIQPQTAFVKGEKPTSELTYSSVWPGQDVHYSVSSDEVKESVVLPSLPAATQTSWSWLVHAVNAD